MKLFEPNPEDPKRIRLLKIMARRNLERLVSVPSSPIVQGSELLDRKAIEGFHIAKKKLEEEAPRRHVEVNQMTLDFTQKKRRRSPAKKKKITKSKSKKNVRSKQSDHSGKTRKGSRNKNAR